MKLSSVKTTWYRIIGWLMSNKLKRIWKEAVLAKFEVLFLYLPGTNNDNLIITYLTMLSLVQATYRWMTWWLVNNELKGCEGKWSWPSFRYYHCIYLEGARRNVFMIYLTTLSLDKNIWRQMKGWSVNSGLESMWKEEVVAYFELLYRYLRGGSEENFIYDIFNDVITSSWYKIWNDKGISKYWIGTDVELISRGLI